MTAQQPDGGPLLWRCTHTGCIVQVVTDGAVDEHVVDVHDAAVAEHKATHTAGT